MELSTPRKKLKRTTSQAFISVPQGSALVPVPKSLPFKRRSGFQAALRNVGAPTSGGPEWKNSDSSANIAIAATKYWAPITLINGMQYGTSPTQHIGRKIAMRKLVLRMLYVPSANLGTIRVCVFYDNNPNGAAPAITDLLTQDLPYAMANLSNSDRFLILYDGHPYEECGVQSLSGSGNLFKKILKWNPPLHTQFNTGSAGTIADIQTGALFITYAASTTAAQNTGSFTYYSRLRFTDN